MQPIQPESLAFDFDAAIDRANSKQRQRDEAAFEKRVFFHTVTHGVESGELALSAHNYNDPEGCPRASLLASIVSSHICSPLIKRAFETSLPGKWDTIVPFVSTFIDAERLDPKLRKRIDSLVKGFVDEVFQDDGDQLATLFASWVPQVIDKLSIGCDLDFAITAYFATSVFSKPAAEYATPARMEQFEDAVERLDQERRDARRAREIEVAERNRIRAAGGNADDGLTPSITSMFKPRSPRAIVVQPIPVALVEKEAEPEPEPEPVVTAPVQVVRPIDPMQLETDEEFDCDIDEANREYEEQMEARAQEEAAAWAQAQDIAAASSVMAAG